MVAKDANISSEIQDPRFKFINTDPRFLLPSKKSTRTKIDKRFSRMLTDEDFYNSATVDRYGRKLEATSKKRVLERLYLPADKEDDNDDTSDSSFDSAQEEVKKPQVSTKLNRDKHYDPARGGGFSSSEDEIGDGEDDSEMDLDCEVGFPDLQAAQTTVEMGDISSRFAVVNLDWDNIKSVDLFAVFTSFLPVGGKIHKISIFPSEFGKERMDREETEGPPKEIFAKNDEMNLSEDDLSEDDEKIAQLLQKPDDGVEYNNSALRQYQLERLRYFYAVVTCSSASVAQAIYEATDGREYLSSANFLDLRFIPDEVEFEEKPRDECTDLPAGYRPTEFTTTALQHSKVKLTWDMEPSETTRAEAINRAFSGAPSEINENDLQAYIGSDSESDPEVPEAESDISKSKKELTRQKIRSALGLGVNDSDLKSKKPARPVGDMEVTFTTGLSNSNENEVFQNKPIEEETTAERYKRKERERKARRKERAKARRENHDQDLNTSNDKAKSNETNENSDPGFDDSFFASDQEKRTDPNPKSTKQKTDRLAKREKKISLDKESSAQKAQLELLMGKDNNDEFAAVDHFDMNEILRAEKDCRKKGKLKSRKRKRDGLQIGFEMDVDDPRFGKVFESHEYAIDPSNPRFKPTNAMKMLLEEGRKRLS